jgi:hypothetical protein
MTQRQVTQLIHAPINRANHSFTSIHYTDLQPSLRRKIAPEPSLRTIRRYGKEQLGGKNKHSKKRTPEECQCIHITSLSHESFSVDCTLAHDSVLCFALLTVTAEACEEIAKIRRRLQRLPKRRVLFLDETAIRLSEAPTSTIVLPGNQPYILATDTTSYAARFDMIACISYDRTFVPCIWAPKERKGEGVKGINTEMLIDYIYNTLGQETAAIDDPPLLLVLDKSGIHSEERILEAFRERGGHVQEVLKTPPMSAKRLSPLDNSLFHDWKEAIRKHGPLTLKNIQQVMADEWNRIPVEKIRAHYQHCGLMRGKDPYFDCPDRAAHHH